VTRLPPPLLALAAAAAQRALSPGATAPGGLRAATAGLISAGSLALAGASAGQFRRSGTTVEPFRPDRASTLVTTGANSVTRNPMYVGMAGLLVAHAVRRGSWPALLPAAGFVGLIDRWQVEFEEEALRGKFGPAYDAYCAAVPRWLDARSLRRAG
jgi:protein-S-isoprenylcysteine O-methyltransferase Ste14